MELLPSISLDGAVGLMAVVALLYLVLRGRIEVLVAILLVVNQWTRTVFFFAVPHVYVLVGLIIVTAMLMLLRKQPVGSSVRKHRWIIPWLLAWWFWQGLINLAYPSEGYSFRLFLINIGLVVPLLWLYVRDIDHVRSFALAYLVTAVVCGALALNAALGEQFWSILLADPLLSQVGAFRYVSYNYNFFAAPFSISIVLAWTLASQAKRRWQQMTLLVAILFCCYMVILIGSRQHVLGAALVIMVIAGRYLRVLGQRDRMSFVPLVALVGIVILGAAVYVTTPDALLRPQEGEYSMSDAVARFGARPEIWTEMWGVFSDSPVFGSGLDYNAHNLFLGTLVTQGLVGFIFLGGWLVFALQVLRDSFRVTADRAIQEWQWSMVLIAGMAVLAGQISGDPTSLWHLFWPVVIAWNLQSNATVSAGVASKWSPNVSSERVSGRFFGARK